jgi:transketolase
LRESMGERFINAGVAEQNMIGVAAGMAYQGFKVFCYSIAPFIVYRCLEQFRNDVCFHKLPVFIVGNGGGFGYGIMGSSHHALEDIACLSGLPNVSCYVPAFNDDLQPVLEEIISASGPAYLRLGLGKQSPVARKNIGTFTEISKVEKPAATIVALGSIVNNVLDALSSSDLKHRFDLFTLQKLPMELPEEVIYSIMKSNNILIVEEHKSRGGIGERIALHLLEKNIPINKFISLSAKDYSDDGYGNQEFHQRNSGLDKESIEGHLRKF